MSREGSKAKADAARKTLESLSELFPVIDPKMIQSTVNNVLNTLNEPEFREEVKRTVDLSYTTSLQILQRFMKLSQDLNKVDSDQRSEIINQSVPKLIKTNLSMAIDLMTLNQKYSSMLLDILEKSTRSEINTASNTEKVKRQRPSTSKDNVRS
ncbi:MAG TPA: hypothetical protein VIH27_01100 [Nitrososphaerales archaeon]